MFTSLNPGDSFVILASCMMATSRYGHTYLPTYLPSKPHIHKEEMLERENVLGRYNIVAFKRGATYLHK